MRIFEHFNKSSICILCKNNHDGKAVLIPLDDTLKDNIEEAIQVHLDCLQLRMLNDKSIIYQKVRNEF